MDVGAMTTASPRPPLAPGETRPYPVLPLRDIVVFPHMIVPLFLGRKKSIRALEEVMRSDTFILLATQKKASDEEGRDHVRKYNDVAQRQHRIGSGFTWRKRWAWLCSGHGPKPVLWSLSAVIRLCAATTVRAIGTPVALFYHAPSQASSIASSPISG